MTWNMHRYPYDNSFMHAGKLVVMPAWFRYNFQVLIEAAAFKELA